MNLRHLLDLSRISLRNLHLHSGSRGNTRSSVSRIFSGGENYLHAIRESSSKISSPPRRGFLPASSSGISSRVINNGSESRARRSGVCEKVRTGRINICWRTEEEEEEEEAFSFLRNFERNGWRQPAGLHRSLIRR